MIIYRNLKISLLLFALLSFGFLSACHNKNANSSQKIVFSYTQITKKVCDADSTQSYEVYLPSSYSKQQQWPIIYVFDPHGDGLFAVEHFKYAAEKYGFLIFGSNNSRNGLQTLEHTLDVLYNDVQKNFSVNPNRQYAAGFSGGGRVAAMLATKVNIKGIITCGAGMSGFNPQTAPARFDIYAIAGREDFNYDEVMAIQQQFANTDWRFITTAFDGGHNWPSAYLLSKAVLWFQLNGMKDGLIAKDKGLEEQTLDSLKVYIEYYMKEGSYVEAYNECKNGISTFDRLLGTKKLERKLADIQTQDGYINEVQKNEQLKLMEAQLKNQYIQSFNTKDMEWWKAEISGLVGKTKADDDLPTRQMYSRMKGFLGIVCYSFTSKNINENNIELAKKCIAIYGVLEPQNPDCFFYKALLLEKENKPKEAADTLKKSISLGFKEISKIRTSFSKKTVQLAGL
jgi:dienelactone hydrolase